jgi:hypothetical protein
MKQSEKNLDGSAFSRAVLAEDSCDPITDGEGHVVQRDDVLSVLFGEVLDLEQRFAGHHACGLGLSQASA